MKHFIKTIITKLGDILGLSIHIQIKRGVKSDFVLVDKFETEKEAKQEQNSYASRGINLRISPPGTFLGTNDQFYLLCAGFEITLINAQRIKNQINQQGVNSTIQKF